MSAGHISLQPVVKILSDGRKKWISVLTKKIKIKGKIAYFGQRIEKQVMTQCVLIFDFNEMLIRDFRL